MLLRNSTPSLYEPAKINLRDPEKIDLPGNVPVYIINDGTQEVVKIEFIYNAGSRFGNHPYLATLSNELIDEGTSQKPSAEIAETFDYYGAYLQTECNVDYASVTLFSLNKFLNETLPLLIEILTDPVYPEMEIATFIQQEKQRLNVKMEKTDFLAAKHFNQSLFPNHVYGYFPNQNDYDSIHREMVLDFFEKNYLKGLNSIIVSGKVSSVDQRNILNHLKNFTAFSTSLANTELHESLTEAKPVHKHIDKKDAMQTAIRVGKRLFNRNHPDYPKMQVLNTILGGYFGSRLMSNIREDKGYTYGIGSGLASLHLGGYFYISTEVGTDVAQNALKEIYIELERLQQQLVPNEELTLVKNYLYGSFQRSIDGAFAQSERLKTVLLFGLKYDYYYRYLDAVKTITGEQLLELARQHLSPSEMTQVTTGKL